MVFDPFSLQLIVDHHQHVTIKTKERETIPLHVVLRNLEMPDVPVYSVKAHKEILNSIDGVGGLGIGDGAPEIVTGSRDGESSNLNGQN